MCKMCADTGLCQQRIAVLAGAAGDYHFTTRGSRIWVRPCPHCEKGQTTEAPAVPSDPASQMYAREADAALRNHSEWLKTRGD